MKKAIIIRGKQSAGKSTTIREVCKRLNPQKIYILNTNEKKLEQEEIEKICNNIYLISVKDKWILVFAGSPTELEISISFAIEVCIELEIDISFILVSRRYSERKENFNTYKELEDKEYEIIDTILINKIEQENFEETEEWEERIEKIINTIKQNLNI
ncbi:hypothetical protein [Capnocytophaga canimorsus]|uniref:Uncharacterized protein n=1 Tax=Capnocytophaga canimorsus TaxID=28188 RepID=A0AAD0E8X5_9FLAO|nr:hypothetical protein [Capnocytophaga canimorsus]ATA94190.1 hypothetical protein CGC54_07555 [Capnocytophaga canimorsus]AWL78918.1 hypothetical protein DKB58_08215 [Capnocytophaga canimorsus]AYW37519.1 hypothetical protein D8L92_09660 [Capnocytophaga canimorsus]MDT9498910.1 hypothetical protein [Capnocytophaga canimorsus]